MKPEILLKAYVHYQSEDAFRELVAGTLDEVYSTSLRIAQGAPHLAGEITLSAYLQLARKAPGLVEDVALASWLRKRACRMAVKTLRAEERPIDWAAVKREKNALATPADVKPAPPGLAIRICQTVFLSVAPHRRRCLSLPRLSLPRISWPAWIRRKHLAVLAVCLLVIIAWRNNPFHHHNRIIRSQGPLMTPSSFAQLGSPDVFSLHMANTNVITNANQK